MLKAVVLAYAAPAIVIGQLLLMTSNGVIDPEGVGGSMGMLMMSLTLAPIMGSPYVLPALVAWWGLHKLRWHTLWAAGLVGLADGAAVGAALAGDRSLSVAIVGVAPYLVIGTLTGLGVWWVAYGRQGRLAQPVVGDQPAI